MRIFSKSKLLSLRQCPKRLWLEIHHPELCENSTATKARFQSGSQVGEIARKIYDPESSGVLIDIKSEGVKRACEHSAELLRSTKPVFEAGFSVDGALAFADVMLPRKKDGRWVWHMVEVKSSARVKDYHHDDVAVQAFAALSSGVSLESVVLAHIDSSWVYPGDEDYQGLLAEKDLTTEAFARTEEVKEWIARAQSIASEPSEPAIETGSHCNSPFECGFYDYCSRNEMKPEYPINLLPHLSFVKAQELAFKGINDLRNVPDNMLNDRQRRVKEHTLANTVFFDAAGAAADLATHSLPAYFLDFETIQFAVPIWKGTRPYQQITFQFSLHKLAESGHLEETPFLDLSGNNPSEFLAKALIAACGEQGPVFVYNAQFESACIKGLAERYPDVSESLFAINARLVDLLPVTRERYYHPSQQGSWSLKKVLPALVPELCHDDLDGVQDGEMAMTAFLEGIHPSTSTERKKEIEDQLLAYCKLDTYAMVRLWQILSGHTDLNL